MKKFLKVILILVVGFACGVVATCYLSMRASSSFIDIIKVYYRFEQQLMAIQAKKRGDMNQVVNHYNNLVSVSSSPGLYCFSKTRDFWSMDFPFSSIILRRIVGPSPEKTKRGEEAIDRAALANALEESGRIEEANSEYIKTAKLIGCGDDIARVKEIGKLGHGLPEDTLLEILKD